MVTVVVKTLQNFYDLPKDSVQGSLQMAAGKSAISMFPAECSWAPEHGKSYTGTGSMDAWLMDSRKD